MSTGSGSGKCDELLTSSLVAAIFRSSPSVVIFHTADRSPQNDFGSLPNYPACYNDSTRDILNFDFSLFCGRVEIWCGVFSHSVFTSQWTWRRSSQGNWNCSAPRVDKWNRAQEQKLLWQSHYDRDKEKKSIFLRFSLRAALIAWLDLHVKYLHIFVRMSIEKCELWSN